MRDVPDDVQKIIEGPVPAKGVRTNAMLRIGYVLAERRWTNHEILNVLEVVGDYWGCLSPVESNKFLRYKKLMGMIGKVRERYPAR